MSEPEDLLEQLGELEREHDDAFPHVWEDVVRGDRTTAEALTERQGIDDPEQLRAFAEVLRPLGAEEREAWVDRLAATLDAPVPAPVPARPRARGRMIWLAAGASLAAAALVLLVLRPRDEAPVASEAASLPGFELLVRNETVRTIRSTSDPEAIARYQPSSSVDWVIRPGRSVAPPLGLRVLAEASSPEVPPPQRKRLLDPGVIEVSPRGVITLRGTLRDVLPLAAGRWSLRMIVAAPAGLPADLAALDAGGAWVMSEPYVIDVID